MQERGNGSMDSGLVLSTDAKPRLKWTPDLHQRFIEAVNQLGGSDSKSILIHCRRKKIFIYNFYYIVTVYQLNRIIYIKFTTF